MMAMTVEMDAVSFMVKIVRLHDWDVVTCVRRRITLSAPACDTIAQATCKRALLLRSLEEFRTADKHDILRHSRQVKWIERVCEAVGREMVVKLSRCEGTLIVRRNAVVARQGCSTE